MNTMLPRRWFRSLRQWSRVGYGYMLLAGIGLMTLCWGSGRIPLLDRDEPRFARATIEMIDLLGFTALRGKEVPGGFELEGGFFFGNDTLGLADTVAALVDLGETIDDLGNQISATRSNFQQALTTFNDEFYRLRLQDWDNAQRMP